MRPHPGHDIEPGANPRTGTLVALRARAGGPGRGDQLHHPGENSVGADDSAYRPDLRTRPHVRGEHAPIRLQALFSTGYSRSAAGGCRSGRGPTRLLHGRYRTDGDTVRCPRPSGRNGANGRRFVAKRVLQRVHAGGVDRHQPGIARTGGARDRAGEAVHHPRRPDRHRGLQGRRKSGGRLRSDHGRCARRPGAAEHGRGYGPAGRCGAVQLRLGGQLDEPVEVQRLLCRGRGERRFARHLCRSHALADQPQDFTGGRR